jgi:hypothetical protein
VRGQLAQARRGLLQNVVWPMAPGCTILLVAHGAAADPRHGQCWTERSWRALCAQLGGPNNGEVDAVVALSGPSSAMPRLGTCNEEAVRVTD